MENEIAVSEKSFVDDIKQIVKKGQKAAYGSVSAIMTETYWNIGKRIVEQEQQGKERAEYGKHLTTSEIWKSRFPNLSWTHYLKVLRVSDITACRWYIETASKEMWSVRTLDRNISTQYF